MGGRSDALVLRCPDCGKAAGALTSVRACPGCGRVFEQADGVWDLRPVALAAVKANEDLPHADAGLPTWRRLFSHKRYWIDWCDTKWLPGLVDERTRNFLEIGGGLCYASAIAKGRAPSACVVATDISPTYLRGHARQVGAIFGTPADVYAAADAETLPFADGQFDAVYSQVVLYRLPDPARALREISRVLAPGGRYLGIERASPWMPAFRNREAREMRERSAVHGLGERPLTYREWEQLIATAGVPHAAVAPEPGRRVRSAALRRLGNGVRPIYVTIRMSR